MTKWRGRKAALFLVATLAAANIVIWTYAAAIPGHLVIALLDVGQGDGIVVETPSGHVLVIDTGPTANGDDAGRRVLLPYLRSRGINRVDALVLTHEHADHTGGAATLLQRIAVDRMLVPTVDTSDPVFRKALEDAHARRVAVVTLERGQSIDFMDGVRAEVLNPSPSSAGSPNNGSLSIRIHYGSCAAVFTGDAEAEAESEMVSDCDLTADILKLGHHGSRTSSTESFLLAVRPQAAIISVGAHNVFGHPSSVVVGRLGAMGIPVFRTDRDGAVIVEMDGRRIGVRRTHR